MFELIAVDGKPAGVQKNGSPGQELILPQKLLAEIGSLREGQAKMMSVLLAQQSELAKLSRALATVRISRTQEIAMQSAIKARAAQLARDEALCGCERQIAAAIRTTLRETTGARAIGDLQAGQFERAMELVTAWRLAGALRRIRRETEARRP